MRISVQLIERIGDCLVDDFHVAFESLAHLRAPAGFIEFDSLVPVIDHLPPLPHAIIHIRSFSLGWMRRHSITAPTPQSDYSDQRDQQNNRDYRSGQLW